MSLRYDNIFSSAKDNKDRTDSPAKRQATTADLKTLTLDIDFGQSAFSGEFDLKIFFFLEFKGVTD